VNLASTQTDLLTIVSNYNNPAICGARGSIETSQFFLH